MASPSYGYGAVPTGQRAPAEIINSTHHGAWVIIATALGLLLGVVCLLIRIYVRVIITPPFSKDDYLHGAATVFALIQSVVVFFEVSKGFGTSIELLDKARLDTIQQAWVASDILFIIGLYLSKCSLIFLFLRLTPNKLHNKASWATFGLSTLWMVVSVFIIAVNCELNHPWGDIAAKCTNMLVRWQIVTVVDIVVEIMLVCLAAYLVHDLKMSLSRKAMVVLAFFFRLPLIAFAILRLRFLSKGITSLNPTLDLVGAVVWAEIELHYSNLAGTIPCLRPFMLAVSTDYGATEPRPAVGSKGYGSYGSGNHIGRGSSYRLSSMRSGNPTRPNSMNPGVFGMSRRGTTRMDSSNGFRHGANNKSTVIHEVTHQDSNSIGSNDSRKMIIKKEVDFRVEHGTAGPGDEELGIQSRDGRAL